MSLPAESERSELPRDVRVGEFELDLRTAELRNHGQKFILQGQPFQVMAVLLERPGELVAREHLKKRLWPSDTFVDFDHSLNKAVNRLREALNDSAEKPRYVETIARRGYRLIAPVEWIGSPPPKAQLPASEARCIVQSSSIQEQLTERRFASGLLRRHFVAILVTMLVLLFAGLALLHWRGGTNVSEGQGRFISYNQFSRRRAAVAQVRSIAVLPLDNLSHDPEQEYFADGMTEALIDNLSKIGALRVISRTSVMQYKKTRKSLPEIAGDLRVDAILEGSVQRSANHVRITAQLIDGKMDAHLWARSFDRDLSDVLALESEVAKAVASEIQITLTPADVARLPRSHAVSQKAHDAYLRGRYLWNTRSKEGLEQSITFYQEAIKEDPQYALAYAGIADSYILLENNGQMTASRANSEMRMAAMKAVTTDPNLADAHMLLADVRETEWNWAGAEEEYKRALELNPGSARAHHWYAVFLSELKRFDEAVLEINHAVDLEPLSPRLQVTQSEIYYFAGRFDEALEVLRSPIISSDSSAAHTVSGLIHLKKADFGKAIAELSANVEADRCADSIAYLAYGYARAGQKEEALASLQELQQLAKDGYVEPGLMAMIWTGLGNNDRALELLQEEYRLHASFVVSLGSDPVFEPLHSDSRFQAMLSRMGLP
jgi:TolB-like protein/DNA-binding winged helix-turn-helix (wHTH) protein/Tfp pilus assembly protein PilF